MDYNPQENYQQRQQTFAGRQQSQERRSRRFGNLNLLLLAALIAAAGLALWYAIPALFGGAGMAALALVWSFVSFRRARSAAQDAGALAKLNREGLARLARDWDNLPRPSLTRAGEEGAPIDSATAADLDLLGTVSLEHLLNTAGTAAGRATVRRWIQHPADPATVSARQEAVAELAPLIDLRQDVARYGRLMGQSPGNFHQFIDWAEGEPWLTGRSGLLWLARLLTLLTLALLAVQLAGLPVFPALIAVVVANLALTFTSGLRVASDLDRAADRKEVYGAYAGVFDLLASQPLQSAQGQRVQRQLASRERAASAQLRSLARLMPLIEIRRSMFFIVIQALTLWSFHALWLLERWQARSGHSVRGWLEALGEAEALMALATLRFDHPGWTFPRVSADLPVELRARGLAHPMLPPHKAVGNDVQIGPPGTFLLVTGSNMSGKSTLLRAVGVNAVLAQMGGPVSAVEMDLPPLVVASSMRVQDSLDQGVSYFMAELRRLKVIADLADQQAERQARPLLYLLDEILQGTNTSERRVAARQVILHLLRSGAIGAVSTHDLTLADAPELAAAGVPVHLSESFSDGAGGPTMTFDYTLRPGIATSTNALKLMALVGLPLEEGRWMES